MAILNRNKPEFYGVQAPLFGACCRDFRRKSEKNSDVVPSQTARPFNNLVRWVLVRKKTDPKLRNPFLTSNRFFARRLPVYTRRRLRAAPRLLYGHETEQTAVNTSLAGDGDRLAVDFAGEFFRGSDAFGLSLFEFGTTGFEFSDGRLRRTLGVTLRDQEVTSVAVLNLNDSAEFTEVIDFFEKNDLHD